MTAPVIAMLATTVLAMVVVGLVALPARRDRRWVLTERAAELLAAARHLRASRRRPTP